MAEKRFKVALSFPGENREFIEQVATLLSLEYGKPNILYDSTFLLNWQDLTWIFTYPTFTKRFRVSRIFPLQRLHHKRLVWAGMESNTRNDKTQER